MDLNFTAEENAFRERMHDFFITKIPASIREQVKRGEHVPRESQVQAHQILNAHGLAVPHWPAEWGGQDWSPVQLYIYQDEMQGACVPPPLGFNTNMVGPVIAQFASPEMKGRFLPPTANLDIWWCQGFSEPGAGSDLASLRTAAVRDGGHNVVNGQKTWTTLAQYADWIFCLVRTDPAAKKQAGISFLLIDMDSPGVEVKPIRLISGQSPFCETFFTNVKVPKENLVGREGDGWTIGKRLLQHERSSLSGGGSTGRMMAGEPVSAIAKRYRGTDAQGKLADADLRARIVRHEMDARAFALTLRRAALEAKSNQGPSAATSIMKNVGARVTQERAELGIEIMGMQGLGWEGEGFTPEELHQTRVWLFGKAVSIYGGSSEIQNNVIAKRILGMLDHQ